VTKSNAIQFTRKLGAKTKERSELRQGVVTAITAGPPATGTVTLANASILCRRLSTYTPTVNDVVWCAPAPGGFIVLGKLA